MQIRNGLGINRRGRGGAQGLSSSALLRVLCGFLSFLLLALPGGSAAQQPVTATVWVDAAKIEGRISPLLYGQFAEFMFEGIKGGLTAEMIRNRSFEEPPNAIGLSRYWERYPDDRNDDFALSFAWDDSVAYPATKRSQEEPVAHSLNVEAGEGVIPRHGIYQSGIPVRRALDYRGYLWLKAAGYEGRVTVALESDRSDGELYASADITAIQGGWKKYEFTLKPVKADPNARLAILFYGRGRVWLDQVSLLPSDAVDGVRADVIERVRALKPAFIRWPGGNVAQDYHWMWGIGPRDERTTWVNLSWKNEPEPGDFGTDEFIKFCRNVGAEPQITVNLEGRGATAEEAAAWVDYCNGPQTSRYGAMRARNGHPEPYGVKYWEIGNEIWGNWVRGHSDAETYARNYNRYTALMRAVDPSIKFIGCGDNNMDWNRTVLKIAGERMDYFAIHHYYGAAEMKGDPLNLMARPLVYEGFYKDVEKLIKDAAPARQIKLAINEWNTVLPLPRQHSMESAVYAARLMNVFERSSDLVAMSAVSDLVNGWIGGVIQASRHGLFVTPTYLVNSLYANHLGAERIAARVESPTFDTSREGKRVPYLDAVASRTADGKQIFIKAVNTDQARTLSLSVHLSGASVGPTAEVKILGADSLAAANSFAEPDRVTVRRIEVKAGPGFVVELPRHSVSVIALNVVNR